MMLVLLILLSTANAEPSHTKLKFGSFEIENDNDDLQIELKSNGKIYLSPSSVSTTDSSGVSSVISCICNDGLSQSIHDPSYDSNLLSFSSSHHTSTLGRPCSSGRLDETSSSWCAGTNDQNQYWQINVNNENNKVMVKGAIVKGGPNQKQYVYKWKFQYWEDSTSESGTWRWVDDGMIFDGTPSSGTTNNPVHILFKKSILTSRIRFRPWSWESHISARMALILEKLPSGCNNCTNPEDIPITAVPSDELIGIWDESRIYHPVSPLSIDQVIQMPSGTFLLPIIQPNDDVGNDYSEDNNSNLKGVIVKYLKVEIVSADSLEFRPRQTKRRDVMGKLQKSRGRRLPVVEKMVEHHKQQSSNSPPSSFQSTIKEEDVMLCLAEAKEARTKKEQKEQKEHEEQEKVSAAKKIPLQAAADEAAAAAKEDDRNRENKKIAEEGIKAAKLKKMTEGRNSEEAKKKAAPRADLKAVKETMKDNRSVHFNSNLLIFEPAVLRIYGSLSSIKYKGGKNNQFIQHLKKDVLSDVAPDQEHLCACSYSNADNDVTTLCLIDAIVRYLLMFYFF
jgi:hypothetical protein